MKEIVARMQLSQGAFMVNLVKTNKDTQGVVKLETYGRRVVSYGNYTFNKTEPTISAKKTVKQDERDKSINITQVKTAFTFFLSLAIEYEYEYKSPNFLCLD